MNQHQQNETVNFQQPTKNPKKKKKRKGKKRKGGKGKGNEKGKRIWILLKDFWQKIETMYISKKTITIPPFKKQTKKKP